MARAATSRTFWVGFPACLWAVVILGAAAIIGGCALPSPVEPSPPVTAQTLNVPSPLPKLPNYIPLPEGGGKQDFRQITNAESERRGFDLGGVNITFGRGCPIVSPITGRAVIVDYHPNDGRRITIDYGVIGVNLYHLDKTFIREGSAVTRGTVLGTEGSNKALYHIHTTPTGNRLVNDISYGHKFSDYYYEFEKTPRVVYLAHTNNLIDPDKYAGGYKLMLNFWDGVTDYDTPYRAKVAEVEEGLKAFAARYPASAPTAAMNAVRSPLLVDRINAFVEAVDAYRKKAGDDAMVADALRIYDDIRAAMKLINLTSIFIKPGMEDQYIAWNPQHRVLINGYRR